MFFYIILSLFTTQTANQGFTSKVNIAYEKGEISLSKKINILENAIKNPSLLSEKWQKTLKNYPFSSKKSKTAMLVDLFQLRLKKGYKENYPNMPNELAFHIDSTDHIFRVYYENENQLSQAQLVLSSAEYAYDKEVTEWGFYDPPLVTPENRYRFYIMDTGMGGGGYTAPIETYAPTAWDDCVTYIVIDPTNDEYSIPSVVAHEFNHATQAAMDCLEPSAFWENTATYMMIAVYPQAIDYIVNFLPDFQTYYYWSLSDGDYNSYYYYGGYIWPLFLANRYGSGDFHDATIIREMWEASMQSTGYNSPNYLEGIDTVLTNHGTGTFEEAFNHFSRARYFFGDEYSPFYSEIPGSENVYDYVDSAATLETDVERTVESSISTSPEPWGVNYMKIENSFGYDRETIISLIPDNANDPWVLQLVSLDSSKVKTVRGENGLVELSFNSGDFGDSLLVIEHLGNTSFDPNNGVSQGTKYSLTIAPAIPLPVVTIISPDALLTYETYDLNIYGSGFQDNFELSFLPDSHITINSLTFNDENSISANITVSATAVEGAYDLTITNPDGGKVTKSAAVTVSVNPNPPSKKSSSGCSCNSAGKNSAPTPTLLLFMVIFGLFVLKRHF